MSPVDQALEGNWGGVPLDTTDALNVGPAAPTLSVDTLSVSAPGRAQPVLNDVSLTVAAGEILGVVGESGSGKTTLARCVMRQEQPLAIVGGSLLFENSNLVSASPHAMQRFRGRRIALVEQDPLAAFDPLFTIGDQIEEFVAAHRDAIAETAGVSPAKALCALFKRLESFGVRDAEFAVRAWPHQWSRGMLQRALFALATAPAPDLLILDEPTAALDTPVADRLIAEVRRLAQRHGVATILITHDLGLAATACDRILVLRHGDPIETGATSTLLGNPQMEYTRALIASAAW